MTWSMSMSVFSIEREIRRRRGVGLCRKDACSDRRGGVHDDREREPSGFARQRSWCKRKSDKRTGEDEGARARRDSRTKAERGRRSEGEVDWGTDGVRVCCLSDSFRGQSSLQRTHASMQCSQNWLSMSE